MIFVRIFVLQEGSGRVTVHVLLGTVMGIRQEYTMLRVKVKGRTFFTTLFARAHVSKDGDANLPAGLTLFVLNVPATATKKALCAAFRVAGDVKSVQTSNIGGEAGSSNARTRVAHVVFASPAGVKKALALRQPLQLVLDVRRESSRGEPQSEGREELQKWVDSFMKKFDAAERRKEAEAEARHNTMDGDGCCCHYL